MSKRRQPRIKTIPSAKHHNYALAWDLAVQMARENGTAAEICFQQILAAFWSGKLCNQLFCFVRPSRSGTPGRDLVALPPRDEIAKGLLGQHRAINAKVLGELSGWTLEDYQKDNLFRDYIGRQHPTFGLAIRRVDFDRWYSRDYGHLHHPVRLAGAKRTKRQGLAEFIEATYGNVLPASVTYKIIARAFRERHGVEVSERTVARTLGRK